MLLAIRAPDAAEPTCCPAFDRGMGWGTAGHSGRWSVHPLAPSNQSAMYEVRFETPASEFLTVTNRKEMIRF